MVGEVLSDVVVMLSISKSSPLSLPPPMTFSTSSLCSQPRTDIHHREYSGSFLKYSIAQRSSITRFVVGKECDSRKFVAVWCDIFLVICGMTEEYRTYAAC
jgi:hypothetical protein